MRWVQMAVKAPCPLSGRVVPGIVAMRYLSPAGGGGSGAGGASAWLTLGAGGSLQLITISSLMVLLQPQHDEQVGHSLA